LSGLVFGHKVEVADWVRARCTGVDSWGTDYEAIGWAREGKLTAACVFNHYSGGDIWVSIAADGRQRLTRGFIRACFRYAFVQLNTRRITVAVATRNARSITFVESLGFVREGRARQAFADDDAFIFGMLRHECRWIGELAHG
jgi:RimJ/RimL family protein N-acetyltransferase